MAKTKVDYVCKISMVTAQDKEIEHEYSGSFVLEDDYDTDFGGEDVFIMPEIMREAMYHLDDLENEKRGLEHSKSLSFAISDYQVHHIDEDDEDFEEDDFDDDDDDI